jgi:hypothetical protein
MKHRIVALYKDKWLEFTIVDETWWMRWWKNFGGITLSKNTVYLKRSLSDALARNKHIVGHEAIHIYQAEILGWKFIPVYLWHWMKAGFKYRENIMEQEAYNNERDVKWTYL